MYLVEFHNFFYQTRIYMVNRREKCKDIKMREDNWWEKKKYVKPPHPPFQTGVNKKSLKNICKQYYIVFNWISFFYFCWSMGLMVRPPPNPTTRSPIISLSLSSLFIHSSHCILFVFLSLLHRSVSLLPPRLNSLSLNLPTSSFFSSFLLPTPHLPH